MGKQSRKIKRSIHKQAYKEMALSLNRKEKKSLLGLSLLKRLKALVEK